MGGPTREGHQGTGPGAITPDGCAVELYRRLAVGSEPDVIEAAVPAGATLLELGSGAGRVTGPLVERGFAVTAVDESAEMPAAVRERVPGVETVRSPMYLFPDARWTQTFLSGPSVRRTSSGTWARPGSSWTPG